MLYHPIVLTVRVTESVVEQTASADELMKPSKLGFVMH
jgi:hypothetical protein